MGGYRHSCVAEEGTDDQKLNFPICAPTQLIVSDLAQIQVQFWLTFSFKFYMETKWIKCLLNYFLIFVYEVILSTK